MFDAVAMGGRIRRLRQSMGLSQDQLSSRLGVCLSFVGHLERGSRVASLETLVRLSEVLGVSTDYLLLGETGIRLTPEQLELLRDIKRRFENTDWLDGAGESK